MQQNFLNLRIDRLWSGHPDMRTWSNRAMVSISTPNFVTQCQNHLEFQIPVVQHDGNIATILASRFPHSTPTPGLLDLHRSTSMVDAIAASLPWRDL